VTYQWPYPAATVLLLLLVWDLAVRVFDLPVYLVPQPSAVAGRIVSDARLLVRHGGITLAESVGGFLLSVAVGVPLGMALVASRMLERSVMPLLVVSQSFPKVAIAPLIVIWFGLGVLPKLVIGFLIAFFPVVISAIAGMRSVDPELLDLAQSMQGSPFRTFVKIRVPFALPQMFAGFKVAVAFATVGAVVGEWVGADSGLGYLLLWANANLDTPLLFAILVCLMVIGLALYYLVEVMERLLLPWHVSLRESPLRATM
jgi:NitT/TauT family transport system permease protein